MSSNQSHPISSGSFSDVGRAPTKERMKDIQSEHDYRYDYEEDDYRYDYEEDDSQSDIEDNYCDYDNSADEGYLEPDSYGGSIFN